MRVASSANLAISPCPFAPYGTAVVNHTLSLHDSSYLGDLICTGVNDNHRAGNPILHGEMAAFVNCSGILTDPEGLYKLSAHEAREAWKEFSLYTTAEVCISYSLYFLGGNADLKPALSYVCWSDRLGWVERSGVWD